MKNFTFRHWIFISISQINHEIPECLKVLAIYIKLSAIYLNKLFSELIFSMLIIAGNFVRLLLFFAAIEHIFFLLFYLLI